MFQLSKPVMARVVVQASMNLPKPPPADHPEVVLLAKTSKRDLVRHHKAACKTLLNALRTI